MSLTRTAHTAHLPRFPLKNYEKPFNGLLRKVNQCTETKDNHVYVVSDHRLAEN